MALLPNLAVLIPQLLRPTQNRAKLESCVYQRSLRMKEMKQQMRSLNPKIPRFSTNSVAATILLVIFWLNVSHGHSYDRGQRIGSFPAAATITTITATTTHHRRAFFIPRGGSSPSWFKNPRMAPSSNPRRPGQQSTNSQQHNSPIPSSAESTTTEGLQQQEDAKEAIDSFLTRESRNSFIGKNSVTADR